ncbi:MAG TPA: hypothetical protein VL092_00525, partial [Chitinophagaceae bacterium]|nr:hypothetical protein [Chitinophagaceae bacterium]
MIRLSKNIQKVKSAFALVSAMLLLNIYAAAQTFDFPSGTFVDSMSLRSIVATSGCDTIKVRHDNYASMTGPKTASGFSVKSIKAIARAKVNPFSSDVVAFPQAQYVMTYRTIGITNPASAGSSTVVSGVDTINVSYFLDSLRLYNDHSFKIAGEYHDLKVVVCDVFKVEDIPGSGLVYTLQTPSMLATIPPYISVLAEIQIQKYINYAAGSLLSSMTVTNKITTDGVVTIDLTSLNSIKPAGYEVEWSYVDKDPAIAVPRYDFRYNASRIYTNANTFNIPVAQKEGYLVFRVRMVRPNTTNFTDRISGDWSIATDQGTLSSLTAKQYLTIALSRNDTINWNVKTNFVEDGKYKQVMTYYDGLYKTKQSLTKFNSKPGQMIILQQLYDHQFRPVISSLPIPVYNYKKFDYFNNFLRPETTTSYDLLTYDGFPDTTLCPLRETVVPPLQSASQANKYYSTYKTDKSTYNAYIPDAEGYPFTRKIISPENNDKVLFEGSAGAPLQIGNDRHISYLYGSTLQAELNRYYGQDIGKSNYYRKLIKTDNNTQDQFTVTDDEGKTIMSGMIGTPDTNALALSVRKAPVDSRFSTNLLSYPQIRFDDKWEENGSYFVELDANYSFNYNIRYKPFKPCSTINIGLLPKVYYDYEVIDNCGNIKLSDRGALGDIGYTSSPEITYSKLSATYLSKGNHVWNKRTYLKNSDILASVDAYLNMPGGCFKTYNDFVKDEFLKLDLPCKSDFDPCGALKARMMRELYPREKYGPYTPASPGSYTFAGPAPNSIFAAFHDPYDPQPQYLYQVACLTYPDSVYANGSYHKNLRYKDPQTFINIFNDEIAEALLPLHPEYCKLKFCQNNQNVYDEFLAAIKNAAQAKTISRFTLTDIISNDPLKLNGVMTYAELSTVEGDSFTIAKRAFINTICGSNISTVYDACTDIIKDKDETYINAYPAHIQDEFYTRQLELYISNRYKLFKQKLANVADTCGPCATNRIHAPEPVVFTAEAKLTSFTDFSGSIPVRPYASLFDTAGTSTDEIAALTGVGTSTFCTTKVAEIIDGLSSCNLSAGQKTLLKDSLLALYCTSDSLDIMAITPDWLQTFMVSLGISVTDLCNPYLLNFNSFGEEVSKVQRLGELQHSERYYRNMEDLFTNNQLLNLFKHPTRDTQTITLTPCDANPFDLKIAQKLGISTYSPSCTATASVLVIKNTTKLGESNANRLRFVKATDTLDFYFYPKLGGDTNRLNGLTGTTATIDSIKNIKILPLKNKYGYDNYVQSLALRNTVVLKFKGKVNAANRDFEYFISAFDPAKDYLGVEKDSTPELNGMVCNEFIQANKPLLQKAALFNISVGHPSFNSFYTNYFNYNNAVSLDIQTLLSSVTSCAVADSMTFPKLQAHFKLTIPKTVGAYYVDTLLNNKGIRDTFSLANINSFSDAGNYYVYFDIGSTSTDIIFPKVKNAISAILPFGSTVEMFPRLKGDTIAQIINSNWLPITSGALSAVFPTATITSASATQHYMGLYLGTTPGIAGQVYTIRHAAALTPYQLNHLLDSVYAFVHKYSPISVVYTNTASSVSTQFKDWQYNAWKNYVNNLPTGNHNAAIKSVRAGVLKNIAASSGPYSFATSAFSYGTYNQPGLINDLYIDHRPDTDPTFLYFKQLFTSLEAHNLSAFGTKSVFTLHPPAYKALNLVTAGTETRAYKCADTSVWLVNHFDQNNLMTNIFFITPKAMLLHKSNYRLYQVRKAFSSDSFSSFSITMTADAGPVKDTVNMLA